MIDDDIKNVWDGVTCTLAAEDLLGAFNTWVRRCNKYNETSGNFAEK